MQSRSAGPQSTGPHAPSCQSPAQVAQSQPASTTAYSGAPGQALHPTATSMHVAQNSSVPCMQGQLPQSTCYPPMQQHQAVPMPGHAVCPATGSMNMHSQRFAPRPGASNVQQAHVPALGGGCVGHPQSQASFSSTQVQNQQIAAPTHMSHPHAAQLHSMQQPGLQQQQPGAPMRPLTLAERVQLQQQAAAAVNAHPGKPSAESKAVANGCAIPGSMGAVPCQGHANGAAGGCMNGPQNGASGQAQGAATPGGCGQNLGVTQPPPWVRQQQQAAAAAHMAPVVASIQPGANSKHTSDTHNHSTCTTQHHIYGSQQFVLLL